MKTTLVALLLSAAAPARAGEVAASVNDAAGKPVADAVVFVYEVPGGKFAAPAEPAIMDQVNKEFIPRVLPILAGTKVRFPNKDNTHHHIYSFSKAKKFEVPLFKDEPADPVEMDKPGVVKLGCNIHDWMLGYVLVLDNPYFALTGADGKARLSAIPEGEYEVAVWSERLKGPVEATRQKVKVGAAPAKASFKPTLGPERKAKRAAVTNY